mmetsp:Transcript_10483/g.28710  ORF Transcript_10483/g.28710 Transcript_10483/m.28710 type:complete len:340 (-) Transcript_10483:41-1060(-)
MAEGGFWSRLRLGRGGASPLEADLRRITEAESIDTPDKDVLRSIVTSTHDPDDRRDILRHLQECLAESSGRRWRRVHGGLVLLEELIKNGAPALITEISEGMHFDPVQRLTFIERFEYKEDRRVQGIVRQKATALRADLIDRLQGGSGEGASAASGKASPTRSGGRGGQRPTSVSDKGDRYVGFGSDSVAGGGASEPDKRGSSSAYVGFGSDDVGNHMPDNSGSRKNVVNGLVAVGHRDDTDSDSSGNEGRRPRGKQQEKPRGSPAIIHAKGGRKALEDSTDSDSDGDRPKRRAAQSSKPAQKPPPPPAAEVDLLGGFDSPSPAAPPPAQKDPGNLLDF